MPFWASGHSGETKRVVPSSQPVLSERYLTAGIDKEVHGCLYQTVRTTSCEPYQFSVTKKEVHHQTCLILEGKYQQWDPMALHPQLSGDSDISWPQKDYQDDPGAKGQRRPISHSLCGFHHLGVEQNSGPVHSMAVAVQCEHKPRYSTATCSWVHRATNPAAAVPRHTSRSAGVHSAPQLPDLAHWAWSAWRGSKVWRKAPDRRIGWSNVLTKSAMIDEWWKLSGNTRTRGMVYWCWPTGRGKHDGDISGQLCKLVLV